MAHESSQGKEKRIWFRVSKTDCTVRLGSWSLLASSSQSPSNKALTSTGARSTSHHIPVSRRQRACRSPGSCCASQVGQKPVAAAWRWACNALCAHARPTERAPALMCFSTVVTAQGCNTRHHKTPQGRYIFWLDVMLERFLSIEVIQ